MHQAKIPRRTGVLIYSFSQVFVHALSRTKPTMLNGRPIVCPIAPDAGHALFHKDSITIETGISDGNTRQVKYFILGHNLLYYTRYHTVTVYVYFVWIEINIPDPQH